MAKKKNKFLKYFKLNKSKFKILGIILLAAATFSLGIFASYFYFKTNASDPVAQPPAGAKTIPQVNFLSEVYDKIKQNYWDKTTDEYLINLFKLGAEKLTTTPLVLEKNNKENLESLLTDLIINLEKDEAKKEFTVNLASIVLANLKPLGRSGLYTTKDEENLRNTVQNIDPGTDLYAILEVDKTADEEEINKTFQEKKQELSQVMQDESESTENKKKAQERLTQVNRAYQTLASEQTRTSYNQSGAESTVLVNIIEPAIAYVYIKKFSPTTLDDFKKATESVDDNDGLDTLILDLRGNIGGSIDLLQYFLGPFIGLDQYAYEFFHQGERTSFKTKLGWLPSLVRYKKVIILINENTQSTGELMAAVLKKYNVGVLVGTKSKGWGTIEKVFQLDEQFDQNKKYSMFLVHSLALRDDNQPIEGNGVDPVINMNSQDWKKQLFAYFHYDELINAVEKIWQSQPGIAN